MTMKTHQLIQRAKSSIRKLEKEEGKLSRTEEDDAFLALLFESRPKKK